MKMCVLHVKHVDITIDKHIVMCNWFQQWIKKTKKKLWKLKLKPKFFLFFVSFLKYTITQSKTHW